MKTLSLENVSVPLVFGLGSIALARLLSFWGGIVLCTIYFYGRLDLFPRAALNFKYCQVIWSRVKIVSGVTEAITNANGCCLNIGFIFY